MVTAEQKLKFEAPLRVLDNQDHFPLVLTKDDIPKQHQRQLPKVPDLQFWLICRGMSVAELNKSHNWLQG